MLKKILCFCLLLISASALAEETPPSDLTAQQQLEAFLNNTSGLSAEFQQKLQDQYGYLLQQSAGTFRMQRPGKFRWDYILPYPQNIISNGKKIWMYDAELEQVNVKPYSQMLASSPISLLDKKQKLSVEFNIESMPSDKNHQWVKLIPKATESDFKEMRVGLQNGKIKLMQFIDNFEQKTEISFKHLKVNPEFKDSDFEFIIPQGTDVVGDF
ncbi:hypothetical protein MNBD_GAMMA09-287 [hydrothermal vent metagenome]|uniref:Outer-membrane lipoprotein carrier protein n=1 Tax=hydrothermal vent metagenome TaxID=652676 RepID=A0A3B0X1Q9_9ZZZZ